MRQRIEPTSMGRRALLTEAEREAIRDPESKDNPYVAVSRVRTKIEDELTEDVAILREHRPDLLDDLRAVVCEPPETAVDRERRETPVSAPADRDGPSVAADDSGDERAPTDDERDDGDGDDASIDAPTDDELRDALPGSGELLERRVAAVRKMYDRVLDAGGEVVTTGDLQAIVDPVALGYDDADSLWTNAINKNADQGRPNALTLHPRVEHTTNGRYIDAGASGSSDGDDRDGDGGEQP